MRIFYEIKLFTALVPLNHWFQTRRYISVHFFDFCSNKFLNQTYKNLNSSTIYGYQTTDTPNNLRSLIRKQKALN